MNFPVQAGGGAVAIVFWWWYTQNHPGITITPDVVAASTVLWQIALGLFALVVARTMRALFGRDVVRIDGRDIDDQAP